MSYFKSNKKENIELEQIVLQLINVKPQQSKSNICVGGFYFKPVVSIRAIFIRLPNLGLEDSKGLYKAATLLCTCSNIH